MLMMLISCCLVCYQSALCVQCLWWVSGMAARKNSATISWCHVLLGQSDIILSSYADQRRNGLWKRQIRPRNVSDGLVLWSQSLKIVWVGFATTWPSQSGEGCGRSALPVHRKRLQGETAGVFDVHVAILQLDLIHLLLWKPKQSKEKGRTMSTERRTTSWAAVEAHVAFIEVIWLWV